MKTTISPNKVMMRNDRGRDDSSNAPDSSDSHTMIPALLLLEVEVGLKSDLVGEKRRKTTCLVALQVDTCPDINEFTSGTPLHYHRFASTLIAAYDIERRDDQFGTSPGVTERLTFQQEFGQVIAEISEESLFEIRCVAVAKADEDPIAKMYALACSGPVRVTTPKNSHFVSKVAAAVATHMTHRSTRVKSKSAKEYGGLAPWQERKAKKLLDDGVRFGISLQDLADACDISVRHFTRSFRQTTGTTPHAWLTAHRIERAKVCLISSGESLQRIAEECGFSDQSHFTRSFKRVLGVTPASWRRANRR